jgi:hypothetical protein
MATNIAALTILRVTMQAMLDQQLIENVMHFRANTATTLEAAENVINSEVMAKVAEMQSNELAYNLVTVQSLYPVLTDPYEEAKAYNGQIAFPSLPTAMATVISFKTGLGGRSHRGRFYMGATCIVDTDGSRLIEGSRAPWQTKWNNIIANVGSGGATNLTLGILHKMSGGVPVPVGPDAFTPVTSAIVRSVLGTMRSRIPGHGA